MSEEQGQEGAPEEQEINEEGAPEQTEGKEAKAEGEKDEATKASRVFKKTLKVNGKDKDFEINLDDEEKLTALFQKSLAADEKLFTAGQKEKELKALERQLKQMDPKEIFKSRGMNAQEWAEQVLLEAIEEAGLSDAERELKALKREKEEQESKIAPVKKQLTQYLKGNGYDEDDLKGKSIDELKGMAQSAHQEIEQTKQALDQEIIGAWKESGLPQTKQFVLAISQEMYGASKRGEDISAKEAAAIVKENWYDNVSETVKGLDATAIQTLFSGIKDALSNLDAEAIQDLLGKDVLKKLNQAGIKRVSDKDLGSIDTKKNRISSLYSDGLTKKAMSEKEWEAAKLKLKKQYG